MEISGYSFGSLYKKVLYALINHPQYITAPRGMKINEIMYASLTVENPRITLFENIARNLPKKYLANELALYLIGSDDADEFTKASKFWSQLKTEDNKINSAYGNLIFNEIDENNTTQFDWAKNSIIKDKDTRQAVMHFNRPRHQYESNKDFVCTMYANFHIRNNKLNLKVSMRSNDVFFGLTFDVPFFCALQCIMYDALLKYYPDLELGQYTHQADSLHIYEKDYEIATKMLKNQFLDLAFPMPTEKCIKHNALFEFVRRENKAIRIEPEEVGFINWIHDNI